MITSASAVLQRQPGYHPWPVLDLDFSPANRGFKVVEACARSRREISSILGTSHFTGRETVPSNGGLFTPDAEALEGCVDWAAAYHLPCRPSTFSRTGMLCCHLPLPNLLLATNKSRRLALLEQRIYMTKALLPDTEGNSTLYRPVLHPIQHSAKPP